MAQYRGADNDSVESDEDTLEQRAMGESLLLVSLRL